MTPAMDRNVPDQVIDATMARALQDKARQTWFVVGWVVMKDLPGYPGKVVARLLSGNPCPYVLVADTLAEIHALLPPGLSRARHKPRDPPEVLEIWFVA